jgi:predicted NBD/HSP70 family sugar kinase
MTYAPGSPKSLRAQNRDRVLSALLRQGSMTQVQLARVTGLSPASVSNLVRELADSGRIEVESTTSSGRAANLIRLATDNRVVVAVDVDHQRIRIAVSDANRTILAERSSPLVEGHHVDDDLDLALAMAHSCVADADHTWTDVALLALAVPAPIDMRNGVLGSSSILPGWAHIAVGEELQRRAGIEVFVENDANLGAWGEYINGAGRGSQTMAYLKVGSGIGCGLVLNGVLHHGAGGMAGEIGHTTVDEHGPICRCGNRGCLESFASGPVLLRALQQSHPEIHDVAGVITFAHMGDPGTRRVLADAGRAVGVAVANLCNLINPDRVVVGGEMAQAGDVFLDPLREAVARFAVPSVVFPDLIVGSGLGDSSELVGAVDLAAARLTATA